jgi:hypothetical protein
LTFAVTNLTVDVGETKSNVVTVNAGDGTVTYSSNNTSIVTVDNSGNVTGIGGGDATITANISQGNNYNSASTSYSVHSMAAIVGTFNVTDTSSPTPILDSSGWHDVTNRFEKIEIDGVEQPSVVSAYTFSTTGEHTVKYTLTGQTTIYWSTFNGCVDMINVIIPNNITSIGESAFYGCGLTSATIPNSVTYLGHQSFRSCYSLKRINSDVDDVINIPSSVTNIDNRAFAWSSGITSVVIPDSVTNMGYQIFRECKGLTSVTIEATTPPTLDTDVFLGTPDNLVIYVPSGSVDTYKAAENWSYYASRIQAIP